MRSAMNAIFYLSRTGCPWRYLPRRVFMPRSAVYNIFRAFQRQGAWEAIWEELRAALRERLGREARPQRLGGYNARQVEHALAAQPPLRVEIVKRPDDSSGFIVLPRHWVVERTFSWFGRNGRLAKDYENLADTLAAPITLACIQLAIRRLARP
jgi:transposase